MLMSDAIGRVRRDIGDPLQNFRTTTTGDGLITWFDLPRQNVDPATLVVELNNGSTITTLHTPADYTLDSVNGQLALSSPVPSGSMLQVIGNSWSLFTDQELTDIINESVYQHVFGQSITERFRDNFGGITYRDTRVTLANLPVMQEPLVSTLAEINALWVLATDAATDVNIQTAEGTTVDRSARYSQLMGHIQSLTERYQEFCGQLNVGMYRMETLNLRRVSRTTGRLVPIFVDREYDDHRYPLRELPPIDKRDVDNSGIPSPLWAGSSANGGGSLPINWAPSNNDNDEDIDGGSAASGLFPVSVLDGGNA